MLGENFDATSGPQSQPTEEQRGAEKFLGINFTCCSVYHRIYLNASKDAYVGHCPRCHRPISVPIGPGGSDARFFTAY